MAEDVYKLGDGEVYISITGFLRFSDRHNDEIDIYNVDPSELRKLATVIEDSKRAKDFPEDYYQNKFTDNDDVTGYIK